MIIPTAVQRAAIAAAAVLAVGSVGYVGSHAMNGKTHDRYGVQNSVNSEPDQVVDGLIEASQSQMANSNLSQSGGGDINSRSNVRSKNEKSTERNWDTALQSSTEWKLKNPDASYAITSDLKPGVDMVGGTSLKYHFSNVGNSGDLYLAPRHSNDSTLAGKVTEALKKRVDPDGFRDHLSKPTDGPSASGDGVADSAMKNEGRQPFAPLTDGEGYAPKTGNTSALPPTSTLIGTIVGDINNGTGSGTAATPTGSGPYNNLDSILLPSANHASSDDTLTFVTGPQSGGIQALNSGTSKIYGNQIGTAINPQGQQAGGQQASTAPPVQPNYFRSNIGLRENLVGSNAISDSSRGGDDRDNSGKALAKTWGPSNTTFVDANGNTVPSSIAANAAGYNDRGKGGQSPVSTPGIDDTIAALSAQESARKKDLAVDPKNIDADAIRKALAAANVELHVMADLLPLKGVWESTLHASGIRLRNARGWNSGTPID